MRAVVVGAAGFLGSHVLEAFHDWDVLGVDRPTRLWAIPKHISAHPLSDLPTIPEADVVVSLAATADPHEALRDPVGAYENGVRAMVDTLEYAVRTGARVLHVSTNEVYGHRDGPVYAPRGPYAGAKACQEVICAAYTEVDTTIVVTQSLFGERQQPNKLVPAAIRSLLAGEPITLQRQGTQWASRPFLHARNVADGLRLLAAGANLKRVHVGADRLWSVREVVDTLADALRCEARVMVVDAGGRAGHEVDVEPIGCDLDGWRPTYSTMSALRDVARWYEGNPEWLAGRS